MKKKTPSNSGLVRFESKLDEASILVVDDEIGMQNFLAKTLEALCARVDVAADAEGASRLLDQHRYDVIVLDNLMPGQSGVDWLADEKEIGLFSDVILMTAFADLDTAIAALRAGASDFLIKPFRSNQILNSIAQSLERQRLQRQNSILREEIRISKNLMRQPDALLGSSEEITLVKEKIERAATSSANVVLRGEVGTGKHVSARMLHAQSDRSENPFVWLHCRGLSEEMFQERLFGRIENRQDEMQPQTREDGLLQNAAGGTLFLEEVTMMSAGCQNLLAELLTKQRFRPIGAKRSLELDIRIVCSTTQSLQEAVEQEGFRTDLYYLLNVVEIALPPLRGRLDDILELTEYFLESLATQMGANMPEITQDARRKLQAHHWPGNVLELRNMVERVLIHNSFDDFIGSDLEETEVETLATMERRHILKVLDLCDGNRAAAARHLGVARKTIDRKCQAWGI